MFTRAYFEMIELLMCFRMFVSLLINIIYNIYLHNYCNMELF